MKNLLRLFILLTSLSIVACSSDTKNESGNNEEETATTNRQGEPSGENGEPQNIREAMQEAQNAIQNVQGGQQAQPVNFRQLQELLSDNLGGYERTSKSGETAGAMGMNISHAGGKYKSGNKTVQVDVTDTGGIGMSMMGMTAWASITIDKEDENGYERTTTIDGYKCFEKFRKDGSESELAVLVADRFVVTAKSGDLKKESDMDDLKKVVKAMDLKKLGNMK
jgi:hypothetical protein